MGAPRSPSRYDRAKRSVGEEMTETHYPASVDHPSYYGGVDALIECIDVVENMNFCRGNAIKYLWRAGSKESELDDLYKAKWYVEREIARLERISGAADVDNTSESINNQGE